MKRPIYKRWWFWLIVVVVALGALGSLVGSDDSASYSAQPTITQWVPDSGIASPSAAQPSQPEPNSVTQSMTKGQENALKSAENYLEFMAFSYEGLLDQLEYEGYSTEEATFAVDNCGANWNEQALLSAQNYLNTMAFSYTGLIDQLEYEGFTAEQATYGADNCGADWNEQAAKSAKNYLDLMAFSREGLIDQLLYEGYTQSQAEYGAQANGY